MSEKPALRKPEFIKIKDLERGRSGYNVYVKVTEAKERQIETRDGQKITMVDAVVADETGSAKAFFKGEQAKGVKEGAVIAIRNGVKKIIKGHISLEVDLFGRVTVETVDVKPGNEKNISDEQIKFEPRKERRPRGAANRNNEGRRNFGGRKQDRREERREDRREDRREERREDRREDKRQGKAEEKKERAERKEERAERREDRKDDRRERPRDENKRGERRNYDRDYDRKENNRGERQERGGEKEYKPREYQQRRGERKPMVKINEIDPGAENIRFIAKVISATLVNNSKGNNVRCQLGDETGVVNAFLSESPFLVVGKTVALFGAEARVVREHIEIQRARVEEGRNPIDKVNDKLNISEKAWIPVD